MRVGAPNPTRCRSLRSIFRAIATACSERPPPVRHARAGTLTGVCPESGLDLPDWRRLRKRHARRRWKSGGARMPRRVPPSAFEWPRSSSNVSCRLAHVATSQLLRAASATGKRRGARFPPRRAGGAEPAGRARLTRRGSGTDHSIRSRSRATTRGDTHATTAGLRPHCSARCRCGRRTVSALPARSSRRRCRAACFR